MTETRSQERERFMGERLQAVKHKLGSIDEMKETILDYRQILRNMCRDLWAFASDVQVVNGKRINGNCDTHVGERNPLGFITHLRQTGSLAEFNVKFDSVSAKLELPEDYLVKAYVGALKEEIADFVLMFNPQTMLVTHRLARVQEIAINWKLAKSTVDKNQQQLIGPALAQSFASTSIMYKNDSFNYGSSIVDSGEVLQALSNGTKGNSDSKLSASGFFENEQSATVKASLLVESSILLNIGSTQKVSSTTEHSKDARLSLNVAGLDMRKVNVDLYNLETLKNAKLSSGVDGYMNSDSGTGREVMSSLGFSRPKLVSDFCNPGPYTKSTSLVPPPLSAHGLFMRGNDSDLHDQEMWKKNVIVALQFENPNPSTSSLSLFQYIDRRFLQGCMRVSRSVELVMWLAKVQFEKLNSSQLASIFSKCQRYFQGALGFLTPDEQMGFKSGRKYQSPISLQLGLKKFECIFSDGLLQKWLSFLQCSPTKILMQIWFKGELITMLFGKFCSLNRKEKKYAAVLKSQLSPPISRSSSEFKSLYF